MSPYDRATLRIVLLTSILFDKRGRRTVLRYQIHRRRTAVNGRPSEGCASVVQRILPLSRPEGSERAERVIPSAGVVRNLSLTCGWKADEHPKLVAARSRLPLRRRDVVSRPPVTERLCVLDAAAFTRSRPSHTARDEQVSRDRRTSIEPCSLSMPPTCWS